MDLKKEIEDTTRQLRIHEYDVRMLDQRIQKKENGLLSWIGSLLKNSEKRGAHH